MAIVLVFIVVSFVIWGIGDIFRGFGSDRLAQVGSQAISTQDFRTAYERQLNQLQQQAKRPITSEEAHANGLDSEVLSSLIANAVLDQEARRLGLAMSIESVDRTIIADPTFKGANGQFDPAALSNVLQQNGLTEATFVNEQRAVDLRREIADAVIGNLTVPAAMLDSVDQFRNETRSIDVFDLTASAAGNISPPSAKDLQTYFNERQSEWRAPEYRSLVVVSLTPASIADTQQVTDAAAQAVYEAHKADYGAPERRQVQQATFATKNAADQAAAKIKSGEDFAAAVSAEKGSLVELGMVARSALFDPQVAQAAFSAPAGGVSEPVQGEFGWVIVKAVKVDPATIKPFAEVAPSIKQKLALQQAATKISSLRDRIEDQRTSGKTLSEAAQSVGLRARTISAVDAQGDDKSSQPVPNLPDKDSLLKAAFASDVGMDNDYLSTPAGGYVWFEVSNVDPAHDLSLADVKTKVEDAWRQDQIAQRLSEKAKELVGKLKAGAPISDIAKTFNAPRRTVSDLKRLGAPDAPPQLVAQAFDVPVGGAGSAEINKETRAIFKVNDSQTPPVDASSAVNKTIDANLRQQMEDDILSEYLNGLQNQVGVTVNRAAMASVVAGSPQ